jgi:hypothetical protein
MLRIEAVCGAFPACGFFFAVPAFAEPFRRVGFKLCALRAEFFSGRMVFAFAENGDHESHSYCFPFKP